MPGNDRRHGALRRRGRKGPTKGSGGNRRRGLEGRGPTPKAEDRVGHPRARARQQAQAQQERPSRAEQHHRTRERLRVSRSSEIVFGRNAVAEAAYASVPFSQVFMAASADDDERLQAVVRRAALAAAPVVEASRADLDALTEGAAHQGVAVEVPPYQYVSAADLLEGARSRDRTPLLVALDQVTDPHNLGAVLRSAGAFGADGVIVPARRSVGVTAAAWKVSAGAAARVRVARETNMVRCLERLQRQGCFVVGLDTRATTHVEDMGLADSPLVVVTGSEGRGLSRLVRETCDLLVSVPITGSVDSLNAAVATSISLYEVDRLRRQARGAAEVGTR
ncbi:23S rRNA (guanosine(2251)-2'-O)-methyltransferase RlmB [Actinomyces wuliandei]|uniref:23S rRNA (guanosine(2251)-2'-O)-methyltransferase RlmB n=1 Tax=Actinomyces wuliandei TaxID=2057743 RepID=UPI000FD83FA0|nr:23S rRNA (guanosine(2251)-2'-O)-methyltransferase RlmB [Actinomyces wuliandei]